MELSLINDTVLLKHLLILLYTSKTVALLELFDTNNKWIKGMDA